MALLIAKRYEYGFTIYVKWSPTGTDSYWVWTDDKTQAARFESEKEIKFISAYNAAKRDRGEIVLIED